MKFKFPMDNKNKVSDVEDLVDAKPFKPEPSFSTRPGLHGKSQIGNIELKYKINDKKPGVVLIFNHGAYANSRYNRKFYQEDKKNMTKVWKERNFHVISSDNLSISEIKSRITNFSRQDYGDDSCFICVVHTHGTGGQLLAFDGWYPTSSLYEPFLMDESKWHGKPKLFLIQACLGSEAEDKVTLTDSNISPSLKANFEIPEVIPRYNELLLVRSTIYGFVSFRNANGSWFLKALYDKMTEFGQMDFESMLTLVKYAVARECESYSPDRPCCHEKKQTISVMSTLTKKLFLKKCISVENYSHSDALINHQKSNMSLINNSDETQQFHISAIISEPIADQKIVSFNFELN